jgi:hypothetical protein
MRYNPRVRRLLRMLRTTATASSVVLFVATLILWARTQRQYAIVSYVTHQWTEN